MDGSLVSHLRKTCRRVAVESLCRVWPGGSGESAGRRPGRGPSALPGGGREREGWVPYLIEESRLGRELEGGEGLNPINARAFLSALPQAFG